MKDTSAATKARWEKAVIRRDLRLGKITLEELLVSTPECIQSTPTILIVDMLRYVGPAAIAELNYEAIRRSINLCLPIGALTERAKEFLIQWETDRRKKAKNASSA